MLVGIVASPCHSAFTYPMPWPPPSLWWGLFLTRQFHEWPAATADMTVLTGVLGCSFDRLRTGSPCDVLFKYASGPNPLRLPGGTAISTVSRQQFMKLTG